MHLLNMGHQLWVKKLPVFGYLTCQRLNRLLANSQYIRCDPFLWLTRSQPVILSSWWHFVVVMSVKQRVYLSLLPLLIIFTILSYISIHAFRLVCLLTCKFVKGQLCLINISGHGLTFGWDLSTSNWLYKKWRGLTTRDIQLPILPRAIK